MKIFNSTDQKSLNGCFIHGFTAIVGIIFLYFHMDMVDMIHNKIFIISPKSYIFEEWLNPSGALRVDLYFFNWTNPEDFKNKEVKPKFSEQGPYVLHETYHKVNVKFNDNNSTVTYQNNKTFYFDEKMSVGTLDDVITNINMVPIIAIDKGKHWNFFMRKALSIALSPVPYETTKKIREVLFMGYEDPLLNARQYLPFMDDFPDLDKFAYFLRRNGSIDFEGVFEVGTGLNNTSAGRLYNWNYKPIGTYPDECGYIQSSTAELFERNKRGDKLEFFLSDFCRSIALDYREAVTMYGIQASKFVGNTSFFDEGKPCVCPKKCLKRGVLDYSSCKYTAPFYLSYPHFLNADPSFRDQVEGMTPDRKKHESYFIMNDILGIALEGRVSIQLNALVEPESSFSKYKDVPEILFPLFWFEVRADITYDTVMKIKLLLWMPMIFKITSLILILLGMVFVSYNLLKYMNENKKDEKLKYFDGSYYTDEEMKPLDSKNFLQKI